jgi:phage protein D
MEVTCVGATYPLKERVTRVFKNVTIPQAVEQIVSEYGFAFAGEEHPQVFPQLIIAGSSYWEWIQEQAAKIGYGAYADGMDFYFKKFDKLIDQSFSNAPVLSIFSADIPSGAHVLDRTLQSFNVLHSEHVESGKDLRAIKTVGGVDPLTGKMFLSTKSPTESGTGLREITNDSLFTQHMTDRVASSVEASEVMVDGAAELARFNMPATAKAQGDPRLRPYGTVYIQGTGEATDGYWVVMEVRHMLHKIGDYEVDLKLATDGTGSTSQTSFRKRSPDGVGTVDLNYALNQNGKVANNFSYSSVKLKAPSQIVLQGNQGAKRTPTTWTATKKGV